ncbi:MAG: DNA mismatch repair endonuclease MutL [Verrucomicrobia bacterium]|nr:MAG: DNA mismatch repair endonuclease MutL [Verrucomicrobiota bacterium]PYJ34796.1 MAG: DNA mismatch repair endonuclease MutL [Verrucomicrobiota bacterium]
MGRIRLLPEIVASQVAAGEVVERPASVVKELIENSLDAGAEKIDIIIRRGGISLVRVIDDGCGMDRDDALLSLERHATSKIRSAADLQAVATLGFRGEALPSIASVSRFRLTTRETDAIAGTEIIINGGKLEVARDGGEAPGTQVEVRSLFYNLPARRKFLRSENTESRNIEHQIHLQAIGHPQIAFSLLRDDRVLFRLPSAATLGDRIRDLYGTELLERLVEVNSTPSRKSRISGFIGQAGLSRQTKAQQLIFVNGRAIESSLITAAVREGYHTALMKGQYPVTFLFLELDPATVDVNVHPAKREVRFRDPNGVREEIVRCIQETLQGRRAEWQEKFRAPISSQATVAGKAAPDLMLRPGVSVPEESHRALPHLTPEATYHVIAGVTRARAVVPGESVQPDKPPGRAPAKRDSNQHQFNIIGVLSKLYVLMENADGLVLVDQHAAHERILFEELRRRMEEYGVPTQKLLLPQTFDVPPRDADWIERNLSILQKMGIGIESFGPDTFKIDSVPSFLNVSDPAQFMRKVIDDLKSAGNSASAMRLGEEMIAKSVCRHAVKANDPLRYPEVEKLIRDLLDCDLPYCCPHGRPTMIQISLAELEKKFGRKV